MYQRFGNLLLLAIVLFLAGCRNIATEAKEQLQGRLLIWHPFQGKEAETLNIILDDYRELYPQVRIVSEFVPQKNITEQFREQSQSGLGPDLMISSYFDLIPLIRAGLLLTLNNYDPDLSTYLPRAILQVTHQDNLYGLPFSLNTQVLCYNKTKVERPPETLSEVIKEVEAERQFALTSNFVDTFWGVQIFEAEPAAAGSKPNNAKIELTFDPLVWAAWLEWLQQAENNPDLILADDRFTLHRRFAEGKLAYYVCRSEEISHLKATLGENKFGVATLPGKANRPAGPLLVTKAVVFNRALFGFDPAAAGSASKICTPQKVSTKLEVKANWRSASTSLITSDKVFGGRSTLVLL